MGTNYYWTTETLIGRDADVAESGAHEEGLVVQLVEERLAQHARLWTSLPTNPLKRGMARAFDAFNGKLHTLVRR